MHAPICQKLSWPKASERRNRVDISTTADDSPYAPYLRVWLARRASRHRDLLLNIAAASRIGLAPASPSK